jgi:hypothetical protein
MMRLMFALLVACYSHSGRELLTNPGFVGFDGWRLAEWETRMPLGGPGENACKRVRMIDGGIELAVNGSAEYGAGRAIGDPVVHLLIEQEFPPVLLGSLSELRLRLSLDVDHSVSIHTPGIPEIEQRDFVSLYVILEGADPNDIIWFGMPLSDTLLARRDEETFTDYAGKLIFSLAATMRNHAVIDLDLLPKIRESISYANENGFVSNGDASQWSVRYINFGHELLGRNVVTVRVTGLSLAAR